MNLADQIRNAAECFGGLRLVVLFGSAVKAGLAKESDIDIGVLWDDDASAQLPSLELALSRAAGRAVDLINLATVPPQLRFEIARDGQIVIERSAGVWADFRARAMIDWWDWAPTARMFHAAAARRLRDQAGDGAA